jgi:branched-chain amino acid transport system substrate-binding protein
MHRRFFLLVFVFIHSQCFGVDVNSNDSGKLVFRIASAGPINKSDYALDSLNGAKLAIEDANKENIEIDGKKLTFELVGYNDQGTPTGAIEVAKTIIERKDISAIIGHLSSSTTIITSDLYSSNNVIQITPTATSPLLASSLYPLLFRTITHDGQQAKAISYFSTNKFSAKNILIIQESTPYATLMAKNIERSIKSKDPVEVTKLQISENEMEVLSNIPYLKRTDFDFVIMIGSSKVFASYVRALRRIEKDVPILLSDGNCNIEFLYEVKDPGNCFCSRNGVAFENLPLWPSFFSRYKDAFSINPSIYAAYSYNAVKAIVNGINAAKSLDTKSIAEKMHINTVYGITGPFTFDAVGNLENGTVSFYKANSGGWLLFDD